VIRNLIFDWFGTRVDDLPTVCQATNLVLEQANRPTITLETIDEGLGDEAGLNLRVRRAQDDGTGSAMMSRRGLW